MSLSTDSLSIDENDYVNSAYREKKRNTSSKRNEISKLDFCSAILVTDWNNVHCHIALY